MSKVQFPEFGFYALPGHALAPKDIFHEIATADEIGLGSTWIAERPNTKDIGVMSGIAAATTRNMGIASGLITNLPLRHPLMVAGYASTMATVTDNRFTLGIGRGVDPLADATGTQRLTFKLLEDYIGILRQLWSGATVSYEGPLGKMPKVALGMKLDVPPPIMMGLLGKKTAYWAGRVCDGMLLNSLWTAKAVREFAEVARQGAKDAGKDPAKFRVWTILMTACQVPEDVMLQWIVRRTNTYALFPPAFDAICDANGWDKDVAVKVRKLLKELDGAPKPSAIGDEHTTREVDHLRRIKDLYPEEWIRDGCAVGSVAECLPSIQERFDAGADGILFHGTTPDALRPLLDAWRKVRPVSFDKKPVNPGAAG
ncbi:MAG: TIGR03857 family LLM class F420-dependent oxidoreductase [Steroidobacteraceae bacterium]